jgi:putative phosphoribosyl transferase
VTHGVRWRLHDRREAGSVLAARLAAYAGRSDAIVLALPRGGVPVAEVVAHELKLPLDVFVVRKLGVPHQPEFAFGAIATGGIRVLNREVVAAAGLAKEQVERISAEEQQELDRRSRAYRGSAPAPVIRGRTVILIDDGVATGSSMYAAVMALHQQEPERVVVAVPVGAPEALALLDQVADEVICPLAADPFDAVGSWYEDFPQVSDEEVRAALRRASSYASPSANAPTDDRTTLC